MAPDDRPPDVGLRIEGVTPFTVLLNGVPVWREPRNRVTTIDHLPVIEWLHDGDNLLELRIGGRADSPAPTDAETTTVAELRLRGTSGESLLLAQLRPDGADGGTPPGRFRVDDPLGVPQLERDDQGGLVVGPVQAEATGPDEWSSVRRTVALPWTIPRWAYLDAPDILATPRTREDLGSQYRALHGLLQTKDTVGLRRFLAEKVAEFVAAYPADRRHIEPLLGLEEWLSDPAIALRPLALEGSRIEVLGFGKLARLTDARGRAPIGFRREDGLLHHAVAATFRLGPSGWVLSR